MKGGIFFPGKGLRRSRPTTGGEMGKRQLARSFAEETSAGGEGELSKGFKSKFKVNSVGSKAPLPALVNVKRSR